MNRSALRLPYALAAVVLLGRLAGAQTLRGAVVDSASRLPIPGAVLELTDAAGVRIARGITNERGEYRLARATATHVRVLRLGFRPRDVALDPAGDVVLTVAMVRVPPTLAAVHVTAAPNCPRRSDQETALALWQEARTGLLAAVVAREANPAALKLLAFDRTLDDRGERVLRQQVRADSSDGHTHSFEAAQSARDFVQQGFTRDSAGSTFFLGPDADVLLDDGFAAGYCFRVANAVSARTGQVGVGFAPARRRAGRVDIDGTLWIDTVARTVRDVEFRYTGLPRDVEVLRPGGYVSFREMANGMILVDQWNLRLIGVSGDTTYVGRGAPLVRRRYFAHEVGGEVARATWPDGSVWRASLGTLRLRAMSTDGQPDREVIVRLAGTDYVASPNPSGVVEIPDLLPGPYTVLIGDSATTRIGMLLGTPLRVAAVREVVIDTTIRAPGAGPRAAYACAANPSTGALRSALRADVVGHDGDGVPAAEWEFGEDLGTAQEQVIAAGRAGDAGQIVLCTAFDPDRRFDLRARRAADPTWTVVRRLSLGGRHITVRLDR